MTNTVEPTLYGIKNSNREGKNLWGKNQFNSAFPVSLACYMRDNKYKAVYLNLNSNLKISISEIDFNEVFNSDIPSSELYFSFESKFNSYEQYSYDDIGNIDLVIQDLDGKQLIPLEIKMTVLPDITTFDKPENNWGSELVIRPATTKYCALGLAEASKSNISEVRKIFEPLGSKIHEWNNHVEILKNFKSMLGILNEFQNNYLHFQKPFLVQPIWKTKGQSPILSDNAFDVFIWSDFALSRLFLDITDEDITAGKVNRRMRSIARLFRFLYHFSTSNKVPINRIYTEMSFGHQTDKEFSVNGTITNHYMNSDRLLNPILKKNIVTKLILNGGEQLLKPERRFDQTIYYTFKEYA